MSLVRELPLCFGTSEDTMMIVTGFFFFLNFLFILFLKFIYLFLATLGLCCYTWAFSSCCERRLLFAVVRGLLIAVASLVAELGL